MDKTIYINGEQAHNRTLLYIFIGLCLWCLFQFTKFLTLFEVDVRPRQAIAEMAEASKAPAKYRKLKAQDVPMALMPASEPDDQRETIGGKSDYAPAPHFSVKHGTTAAYIEQWAPVAIAEMRRTGVPASISLAQGIFESRCGTSKLATLTNNHFGIKCVRRDCKRGHCCNFEDDSHKDFFRKYDDPKDSWRDHSNFLSSGKYATLHKFGNQYEAWAKGLKRCGYATLDTYADKIIGLIEQYDLARFDLN